MLAIVGERRLRRILTRLLDENAFLGPCGRRSMSRAHGDTPHVLDLGGEQHHGRDEPAESSSSRSGGNSNWRGPVKQIAGRLGRILRRDELGRRPVFGGATLVQTDPHWRDNLLFYEYFHGDNGAGLGASHQTGWTGLMARFIQMAGLLEARDVLGAAWS
jgi:hypothetical protein